MRVAWALVLSLAAVPAGAEPPRREVVGILGASVNILGLQHSLEASWRWRTSHSTHPLLRDAHFALGVTSDLSPSFIRASGFAQWAPLSVLVVRAGAEPVYYFGILGSLIGFPRQDAIFDEDARHAMRPQAVSELGARFYLTPTLQGRFGRVAFSSSFELEHWDVNGPDTFFYEPRRDTLLSSSGDSLWRVSSVLLLENGSGGRAFSVGLHHEFMRVHDAPANDMQRLGPLLVWSLGERRFGLRQPSLIANVYYYLEDPYKRHEPGGTVAVRFSLGN